MRQLPLTVALLLPVSLAHATNGYQLIGIGAYQKSLAGAITANPGSAMTAITNPAGMARIGKRADFSMEMFKPSRYVDFTSMQGEKKDSAAEQYGVPALGWTAPIDDGSNIYFGGGIYGTSGMGTDYPLTQYSAANGPYPAMFFEGYSSIQFWQMAPTISWNQGDNLSFGVSLNIDYQAVALKQAFLGDTSANGSPDTTMANLDLSRTAQTFGFGISLGVLYDVNKDLTLGASYKSKQSFGDLNYQLTQGDIMDATGQMNISGCPVVSGASVCPTGEYSLGLDFPSILAAGIAYKVTDRVTVSADIKQIRWSETLKTMDISGPNGASIKLAAGWEDQTIMAVGLAFQANERLNLRMGYNHADAPIDNADTDNNYILPATTVSHITFGGDYMLGRYWDLGFHISQASEQTLTSPNTGAEVGLKINTVGINIGYVF